MDTVVEVEAKSFRETDHLYSEEVPALTGMTHIIPVLNRAVFSGTIWKDPTLRVDKKGNNYTTITVRQKPSVIGTDGRTPGVNFGGFMVWDPGLVDYVVENVRKDDAVCVLYRLRSFGSGGSGARWNNRALVMYGIRVRGDKSPIGSPDEQWMLEAKRGQDESDADSQG